MSVQAPDVYLNTMETSQAATSFITVEVHKEWQNLAAGTIPGPITVELRKQSNDEIVKTGVLNSGNHYSLVWADIPAVADPADTYYLREILPSGYVQVSIVEIDQVLTLDNRVTPNNVSYADYPRLSFFIMKPTASNPYIVWTLSAMTEADRLALLEAVAAAPDAGPFHKVDEEYVSDPTKFLWYSGPIAAYDFDPADPNKGYLSVNFTIDPVTGFVTNYNINFQEPSNWTQYMFGSYSPVKYVITNKLYTATGSWTPSVTKQLAGKTLAADMFEFELKEGDTVLQTMKNRADGSIPFEAIHYTLDDVGVHTYTITEKGGALAGVTYDGMTVTYIVTVSDKGDGTLDVLYDVPIDRIFNNVYRATGSFTPSVTKVLTGKTLEADTFEFEMREGATLLQSVKNLADGSIPFAAIHYTEADVGVHTYSITEKMASLEGVSQDDEAIVYVVTVSDNGDGTLAVTYPTPADTVFINVYTATGRFMPNVTKVLAGRTLAADEFEFELKEGATVLQTVKNLADGSIPFTALPYTLANVGVHTYTITEKSGTLGGVVYDTMTVTYVVTVSDKGDGTLNVVYDQPTDTVFNNLYTATGSFTPQVMKVLTGRSLIADEFEFVLKEGDDVLETVGNEADGSLLFATIHYTLADVGTHTYTITETIGSLGGMSYDDEPVTYVVTVTDKGDGTLHVAYDVPTDTTFNNVYTATGYFTPGVTKALSGRTLEEGEFEFELWEGDTLIETVYNTEPGLIPFAMIHYSLADVGTHTYTILEKANGLGGVAYDTLTVTYVVTVSDKGDGTLNVVNDLPTDTVFNNVYTATGSFLPVATKALAGRVLAADEFEFELKEGITVLQTVKNLADGSIPFTAVPYTLAHLGVHTYTITEKASGLGGVTDDAMAVTYVVAVTDNRDGTLTAAFTAPADTEFNNVYRPADTSIVLEATKALAGPKVLEDDEFVFQVYEGETLIVEGRNNAEGKIVFAPIVYKYEDVGTHTYQVREKDTEIAPVDYDEHLFTVKVIVEDNGDGTMSATAEYPEGGVGFVNVLSADVIAHEQPVKKVVTGTGAPNDVKFNFKLRAVTAGAPMPEGSVSGEKMIAITGAGDFTLGLMEFKEEGTYVYEISELASSSERFEVDKTVYTMTITITLEGYFLEKEVVVKKANGTVVSSLTFTNIYHPVPETGEQSLAAFQGAGLMLLAASLVVVQQKTKKRFQNKQK